MLHLEFQTKQLQEGLNKINKILPKKKDYANEVLFDTVKLRAKGDEVVLQVIADDFTLDIEVDECNAISRGEVLLVGISKVIKGVKHFSVDYPTVIQVENQGKEIAISNNDKSMKNSTGWNIDVYEPLKINEDESYERYDYQIDKFLNRINKIDYAVEKRDDGKVLIKSFTFSGSDIVTLDGFRLAMSQDDDLTIKDKIYVDYKTIELIKKITDKKSVGEMGIIIQNDLIQFRFDDVKVTAKLNIESSSFHYKDLIRSEHNGKVEMGRKALENNIKYLNEFNKDDKNRRIAMLFTEDSIGIKDNSITFEAQDENGKYNSQIATKIEDVNNSFKMNEIHFNGVYFLDMLKVIDSENIELLLDSAVSPIIIKSENETHLLLPIRINR